MGVIGMVDGTIKVAKSLNRVIFTPYNFTLDPMVKGRLK